MREIAGDGLPMDEHNRRIAEKNRITESLVGIAIYLGVTEQLGLYQSEVESILENHKRRSIDNQVAMVRNHETQSTSWLLEELEEQEDFGYLSDQIREGMVEDELRGTLQRNIFASNPRLSVTEQVSIAGRFVEEIKARRLPILRRG